MDPPAADATDFVADQPDFPVTRPLRTPLLPNSSRRHPVLLVVLTSLACALTPLVIAAQVNVEALRRDDPPIGRSGSIGGDVSLRTGNVDFIAFDARARLYEVTATQTRLIVGNGGVGFVDRSRFASSGLVHYRRTYTAVSPLYEPEWYGQMNYDRAQELTFRAVGGGGARTSFAGGAWGQFGAGSGLMLEYERLSLPDTAIHPDQTLVVRWSSFLTLRVVPTDNLVITSTTYMQPAVGAFGDYRALENLRLSAAVSETLALTVSFDLRYDSRAPDTIEGLDASLRTGVTYTY